MSRALAMAVAGKACSRTCRGCGEMIRLERFAKSATVSGYGPRCRPCYLEKLRKEARLVREREKREREDTASLAAELACDIMVLRRARTGGDKRYRERQRRCLGPCAELFLSSHCAHRFCPRCIDLVDRSPASEEHWGHPPSRSKGRATEGRGRGRTAGG